MPGMSLGTGILLGGRQSLSLGEGVGGGSNPNLRVVAAAQRTPNGWGTAPSGKLSFAWQDQNVAGGGLSAIQPVIPPWSNISGVETLNGNDVTHSAIWIERLSTGQVLPVTFSGSRSRVVAANDASVRILADKIPAALWTGAPVARGETFRTTGKGSVPLLGNTVPVSRYKSTSLAGSNMVWFDAATDVTGIDYTGALVPPTGATATQTRGFSVIFAGEYSDPLRKSVAGYGDSISDGLLEQGTQTKLGQGIIELINPVGATLVVSTLTAAQSGEPYPTPANIGRISKRVALLTELCDILVDAMGTNNFNTLASGGTSVPAATTQTAAEAVWSAFRTAKPAMPILKTRLLPVTYSTDLGVTAANQTPAGDWASAGTVDQWHTLLAAAVTAGKITAFIDTRSVVGDPTDRRKWLSNGTAYYYTGGGAEDGVAFAFTHPGNAATLLISPVIRLALDDYDSHPTRSYADFQAKVTALAVTGTKAWSADVGTVGSYKTTAAAATGTMYGSSWQDFMYVGGSGLATAARFVQHAMASQADFNALVAGAADLFFKVEFPATKNGAAVNRNGYTSLSAGSIPAAQVTQLIYWDGTRAQSMAPAQGLGPVPYNWY